MKKIILLSLLLFVFGISYGQADIKTKHTARFGVNSGFFGSGDIIGPGIYGEYAYALNDYLALSPRVMSAYASKNSGGYFDHASSFAISLSMRITPLPDLFNRLKLDFGGLYHAFTDSWGNLEQRIDEEYMSSYAIYYQEKLFGLFGSLQVNLIDTKKLESGLRFDMMTSFTEGYFNCDSWQTGIYVGLKF